MTTGPSPEQVVQYIRGHPDQADYLVEEMRILNAIVTILVAKDLRLVLSAWDALRPDERLLLPQAALCRAVVLEDL